ncbi:hypothetical protein [Mycobacterium marseillense]|uniref:hypothetical protein n=1 Tax=Mycobacterium marseillense TaxID=701042 RepID=UPI001042327C|nr:hypothetical protein [Mycobacterium marseillense]MCA2265189.1 hypothetical protein [Mycobacterium marseillense]
MAAHDNDDTQLAITDDANTGVVAESSDTDVVELAWSAGDAAPEVEPASNRRPLSLPLRVLLITVLVAAVGLATFVLGDHPVLSRHAAATTGAVPVHAPPAAPPLDGTYLVRRDQAKEIENGAPNPEPKGDDIVWWAFRSSCRPTDCVATGTELDANNHLVASNPGHTAELHFVNGRWHRKPVRAQVQHPKCLGADEKSVVAGADTRLVTWSLAPQPDGTLGGVLTDTTMTNECEPQGTVLQAPLLATRTGDVAPSVGVADPKKVVVSTTAETAVPAVVGPRLDGAYRLEENLAEQTTNGAPTTGDASAIAWWAFRSLCTPSGCVATATELGNRNHQEATGRNAAVLRFVDGRWQNAPRLLFGPCNGVNQLGADQSGTATDSWSWAPQADRTLGGFSTFTQLTNACGNQGMVYRTPMSVTRVGDVPSSVVLADPALFVE